MSDQSETTEKEMTTDELAETLVQIYAAVLAIDDTDLSRLEQKLRRAEKAAQEKAPLALATTLSHLTHLLRLIELCRPIQEEMKRAPRTRRTYDVGSFVA